MKVILEKELEGRGAPGDVVDVAAGFANNYLIPMGLAVPCRQVIVRGRVDAVGEAKGGEAEQPARALAAIAEDASGVRGESPVFHDGGSLVLWVIDALCDPMRWQWFGREGDTLRIVAAESRTAETPASERGRQKHEKAASEARWEKVRLLQRRKGVELLRSLRIAGRACARLTRALR